MTAAATKSTLNTAVKMFPAVRSMCKVSRLAKPKPSRSKKAYSALWRRERSTALPWTRKMPVGVQLPAAFVLPLIPRGKSDAYAKTALFILTYMVWSVQ